MPLANSRWGSSAANANTPAVSFADMLFELYSIYFRYLRLKPLALVSLLRHLDHRILDLPQLQLLGLHMEPLQEPLTAPPLAFLDLGQHQAQPSMGRLLLLLA